MRTRINVIDPDVRRRAAIARLLMVRSLHVEIYENIGEFAASGTITGVVFMSDESAQQGGGSIANMRDMTDVILPVVFYADEPDPENIVDAIRGGAIDYLRWPFTSRLLDKAFRRMTNDERVVQKETLRNQARARVRELSARETDVLTLLVQGLPNKGIARTLGISPRTVEVHRSNMMSKLRAQSTPDAIRIGLYAGLDENTERPELMAAA